MKKRPAALLEVLIALSLIALCAVPLIRQPIANLRGEMASLKRIEAGRIAAWTFSEIKEKLLKQEIRWSQIPPLKEEGPVVFLPKSRVQLEPLTCGEIERSYSFYTIEEKHAEDKIYRLIAVHVKVGGHPFTYRTTVWLDQENVLPKPTPLT
jgi:hypothetical protein